MPPSTCSYPFWWAVIKDLYEQAIYQSNPNLYYILPNCFSSFLSSSPFSNFEWHQTFTEEFSTRWLICSFLSSKLVKFVTFLSPKLSSWFNFSKYGQHSKYFVCEILHCSFKCWNFRSIITGFLLPWITYLHQHWACLKCFLCIQAFRPLELLEASYYVLYAVLSMDLVVTCTNIGCLVGKLFLSNNCENTVYFYVNYLSTASFSPTTVKM